MSKKEPKSLDDFKARVSEVTSDDNYAHPAAFAVGVATVDTGVITDVRFKTINVGEDNAGSAAVFFGASHQLMKSGGSRVIGDKSTLKKEALDRFDAFKDDGDPHPNIDSLGWVKDCLRTDIGYDRARVGVVAWVPDLTAAVTSTVNAWLLMTMLSRRMTLPNSFDMDGFFGQLPNIAWTNDGPFVADRLQEVIDLNAMMGMELHGYGVDKFPRMTDYVAPAERVRIADASRVRLGAYLSPGTTVMHEGFVNANAGTLGTSMVEGRISMGVVVGDGSDIGGGASIMGTLSGGGKHRVAIGERTLVGANAGIGISLGNDCIVEAGTYVTAGKLVTKLAHNGEALGEPIKAIELSGQNGILFRENSLNGRLEALANTKAVELNPMLHA